MLRILFGFGRVLFLFSALLFAFIAVFWLWRYHNFALVVGTSAVASLSSLGAYSLCSRGPLPALFLAPTPHRNAALAGMLLGIAFGCGVGGVAVWVVLRHFAA